MYEYVYTAKIVPENSRPGTACRRTTEHPLELSTRVRNFPPEYELFCSGRIIESCYCKTYVWPKRGTGISYERKRKLYETLSVY
jgi:hypothetical protein